MDTILFDFFGTLVNYSAGRTHQNLMQTHAYVNRHLTALDYATFEQTWDRSFDHLERQSNASGIEFSMQDVVAEFSTRLGVRRLAHDIRLGLIDRFMHEWSAEIRPFPNLHKLLLHLASDYRLGIVSNTHQPGFVPALMAKFELDPYFNTVVTSVDHGRPKPQQSIYAAALDAIGANPETTVFVGDSAEHDYWGPTRFGMRAILISSAPPPAIPRAHVVTEVGDLLSALAKIHCALR